MFFMAITLRFHASTVPDMADHNYLCRHKNATMIFHIAERIALAKKPILIGSTNDCTAEIGETSRGNIL